MRTATRSTLVAAFAPWPAALVVASLAGCAQTPVRTFDAGTDSQVATVFDAAGTDAWHELRCGDRFCDEAENCRDCPFDCGDCTACSLAPTCTGALSVPVGSERLEAFDNLGVNIVESGVQDWPVDNKCLIPELRMRVRRLHVSDWDPDLLEDSKVNIFCAVAATDGMHSEIFITPLNNDLEDGSDVPLNPTNSTFWGQMDLIPMQTNMTISFECYSTDNGTFGAILDGVAAGATGLAGVPTGYGWAFGVGGIAAGVLSSAITDHTPDPWLRVQQTIDRRAMYELTNGRLWQINGSEDGGDRQMFIEIESWGCADFDPTAG